ncbi:MAG: hypothetical protein ACREUE_07175, partial [Panacagrimonas sp.]
MISAALRLLPVVFLAACGSAADYTVGDEGPPPPDEDVEIRDCDTLFTQHVQPRLDFCRTCHVPGGVADVEDGRDYVLSQDESQDLANLRAAYERLDKDAQGRSRILTMASGTDAESHTGGAPWPVDSRAYREMAALLDGFSDAEACVITSGGPDPDAHPLLGSKRGGHFWDEFCEDKPDDTLLPADPRTLVVPGVNQGKAVLMNAYWRTCQADDAAPNCGEHRARVARGFPIVASDGEIGAGSMFAGDHSEASFAFPAEDYNTLWSAVMG